MAVLGELLALYWFPRGPQMAVLGEQFFLLIVVSTSINKHTKIFSLHCKKIFKDLNSVSFL